MKGIGSARRLRARFLLGAAGALAIGHGAAMAAEGAATLDASSGLDEVVVTAQKVKTNLQDTPISISALSASDLVNRHVQGLGDMLDGSIPSLRVAPFFARSSALTIGMRGIGALGDANQPARDQAVGVYIDGVYLGRAQGLGGALYDVERIEVLKGPQGTLFGRNTEGGAISIVTRAPTGQFGFKGTVGYGNFGAYKGEAHLDLPAFHDISVKLDGVISKRDGTTKNPTTTGQEDFNAYDKHGFHAQAVWKPTDTFTADYAYDTSYDGTTPYYVQSVGPGSLARAPILPLQTSRAKTANVGAPLQLSVGETYGHRLTMAWDVATDIQLKSISAYRNLKQTQYDNGAAALSAYSPNGAFSRYSLAKVYQDQFSQELQVIGSTSSLRYVGGTFYYKERARDNAQTPNSLQFNANGTAYTTLALNFETVPFDRASHVTTESAGVFGQVVWTPPVLEQRTHLTVGGRYTEDKKQGSLDIVNGALPSYVLNGRTIIGKLPLNETWSRFDPLVILAFDATPDVNLYAKYSTGYKSGGANSRSLTYRPFDPETVAMYEVGAKTEFWDRRARFNIAAYYGKLKDVQVDFNAIIVGNNRGTLETTNAADEETTGFEADFTLQPIAGLTLGANYAYTKIDQTQAFNPFSNAVSTVYPLYSPANAGSVSVDYERSVSVGLVNAHLDVNAADGQYTSTTDPNVSDSSLIVNGRLALSEIPMAQGADLQIALWARNLLDEEHLFLKNFNSSLGTYAIFNEPRTFGVDLTLKF